jgi:hypothetical protein
MKPQERNADRLNQPIAPRPVWFVRERGKGGFDPSLMVALADDDEIGV